MHIGALTSVVTLMFLCYLHIMFSMPTGQVIKGILLFKVCTSACFSCASAD